MPGSEQWAKELLSQTGDKEGEHVAGGGSEGGPQAAGLGQHLGQMAGGGNRWTARGPGRKSQH